MRKKVICYIQAFDCEKTIEAAMQSVLNQTYGNWRCFVLSNGNRPPNHSFDVIKNFAARDKRFVVLNKKVNNVDIYIPMLYHLASCFPDCYICSLDADDEYKSDFFERAVSLAEAHRLDIVACGTEIVLKKRAGAKEETLLSRRELEEDLIIQGEDFTRKFPVYKPFFNEMWGKLYNTNLFGGKYNGEFAKKNFFRHFLPDTLFTINNLSRSSAVGVLSGTSHKFYQFEQRSATNATAMSNAYVANHQRLPLFHQGRTFSVYSTYDTVIAFLRVNGKMDREVYEYMQAVLFGWFGDFYSRTLLLTTDEKKVAGHAAHLVFHPKFDELMRYRDSGKYNNLRNYQQRIEFCELLRNMLIGQKAIKNRGAGLIKKQTKSCTAGTKRELDKVVSKLDHTIRVLSRLGAGEN